MTKLYAQEKRVFDINKVTVVGSPTITSDGVASGFDSGQIYSTVNLGDAKIIKIFMRGQYYQGADFSTLFWFATNENRSNIVRLGIGTSGDVVVFASGVVCRVNKSSLNPINNEWLEFIVTIDTTLTTNNIKLEVIKNKTSYESVGTYTIVNPKALNILYWGTSASGIEYSYGSIDLPSFSITVDGKEVYSPTKSAYALERRKEGFDLSKFTVVGSPTITEYGVASGLTTNNYVTFNSVIDTNKTFNFKGSFVYKKATASQNVFHSFATTGGQLAGGCRILLGSTGNLTLWAYTGTVDGRVVLSANNFADGDNIDFEFSFSNNKRELKVSKDGGLNWIIGQNTTLLNFTGEWQGFTLGFDGYAGSINLPSISITVDGKEVFTGAKEKFYAMRGM